MTIPEELLPVLEWWEKDGKKTVAVVAAAAVVVLGYQGVKGWREARRVSAGEALMNAESVEDLESAVASYGSSRAGAALKLRLAKAYYDAGSFQSAADVYAGLDGKAPAGFEDVPVVGAAECLEGLERFAEALAAYDAFADERPESPYALTAKIGAARCLARTGEKDKALERLAALKKEVEADDAAVALVENAEDIVKRWEKREVVAPVAEVVEALQQVEEVAAPEAEAAPAPEETPAPEAAPAPEADGSAPAVAEAPAPEAVPAPEADGLAPAPAAE